MHPSTPRRRAIASIVGIVVTVAVAFAWNPAPAQMRLGPNVPQHPRTGPFGPGGLGPNLPGPGNPFGPNIGPRIPHIESVWTCGQCGKEVARGEFSHPPANCPFCGARLINGFGPSTDGGNGGGMGMTPPANPAQPPAGRTMPPFNPTMPPFNPAGPAGATPPLTIPPVRQEPPIATRPAATPTRASDSTDGDSGLRIALVVAGIAVIAAGVVIIAIVLIAAARGNSSADRWERDDRPRRRRARHQAHIEW
ncbi:MAG TPA: hypothetical protein VG013_12505 [Gemmataceae bacterium]|jgi:DNA-directed RNA polymerase subunit RPC12/RpoP|nr:hypothetical protein [Gemmataceae bacterium]